MRYARNRAIGIMRRSSCDRYFSALEKPRRLGRSKSGLGVGEALARAGERIGNPA